MSKITYVVIIICILILTCGILWYTNQTDSFLQGLWYADESFCTRSGITSMLLYIGPGSTSGSQILRDACLVINSDNQNICKQLITISYNIFSPYFSNTINANIDFSEKQIMDTNLQIDINIPDGCIKFHSDDTLFARLYKDNATSAECKYNGEKLSEETS